MNLDPVQATLLAAAKLWLAGAKTAGLERATVSAFVAWLAAAAERERGLEQADDPEPDPLDESNHTDRIDCYGERWIWCDGCEGFRLDGHKVHKSNYGWSAVAELDGCYGPLTYPPGECDRG